MPPGKMPRDLYLRILKAMELNPGTTFEYWARRAGIRGGKVAATNKLKAKAMTPNVAAKPELVQGDFTEALFRVSPEVKQASIAYDAAVQELGASTCDAYVSAFIAKVASNLPADVDPSVLTKLAVLREIPGLQKSAEPWGNVSDVVDWGRKKMLGDSGAAQAAGFGVDIGSYFVPYLGTARTGVDMTSDFANMAGRGHTLGQRAGYGLSGLGNALWTAMGLFPMFGGSIAGGAGKTLHKGIQGWLATNRLGKEVESTVKAIDAAKTPVTHAAKYMLQGTANPYAKGRIDKVTKALIPGTQGAKYTPGFMNKLKWMAAGAPRQMIPGLVGVARPMPEGEVNFIPPPAVQYRPQNPYLRSAINS